MNVRYIFVCIGVLVMPIGIWMLLRLAGRALTRGALQEFLEWKHKQEESDG